MAYANEEIIADVKSNPCSGPGASEEFYQRGGYISNEELYKDRSVIEHANAWLDGFKGLLVRFEFSVRIWMSLHFMAFSVIVLLKIKRKSKV